MSRKYFPYVFLVLLLLILIFIGGVKYGQRVERANKMIRYILSITPSPRPVTPTVVSSKPVPLNTVSACGISFIYPGYIKTEMNSRGAIVNEFQGETHETIATITCSDTPITNFLLPETRQDIDISTMAATLRQKRGTTFKLYKNTTMLQLKLIHPNGSNIVLDFNIDLLPIIDRTLEFTTLTPTKIPSLSPTKTPSIKQ